MKPETPSPAADTAEIPTHVSTPDELTYVKSPRNSTRNPVGKSAGNSRTRRDGYDAEDTFQIAAAALLDTILPASESWWCHIPNGGNRSAHTGARLKKMGTKAGAPDCMIVWQGRAYWIELKSRYGSLQDSQRAAFPKIMAAGCPIAVARTLDEVVTALSTWGIPMTMTLDAFRTRHGLAVAAAKPVPPAKPSRLARPITSLQDVAAAPSGTIRLSSSEYRRVMALDGDTPTNTNPSTETTQSWQTTKPAVSQRRFWRRRKKSA